MKIISDIRMGGYSEERHAVITDVNGNKWGYTLQYNNRTWKDEFDYLDNAASDFENEWTILNQLGKSIEQTELFEKKEDDEN